MLTKNQIDTLLTLAAAIDTTYLARDQVGLTADAVEVSWNVEGYLVGVRNLGACPCCSDPHFLFYGKGATVEAAYDAARWDAQLMASNFPKREPLPMTEDDVHVDGRRVETVRGTYPGDAVRRAGKRQRAKYMRRTLRVQLRIV